MKQKLADAKFRIIGKGLMLYIRVKRGLRSIDFKREKFTNNFFIALAFFSIAVGLTIFIVFLYKLSDSYKISGKEIVMADTGQVGDFVGGIVGAVWSLTGVLLFYAALRLQSQELAENRKHFQVSRLTDIIYKQLDLFNSKVSNFRLIDIVPDHSGDNRKEYLGRASFSFLKRRMESILEKDELGAKQSSLNYIGMTFAFIELNKKELEEIYEELANQVNVVTAILIKDGIPPADLNELKSIFFRNVGTDFLNASRILGDHMENFITHKKKAGIECDVFSSEHSIKRNISSIEKFRSTQYDKRSIRDYARSREIYNVTSY